MSLSSEVVIRAWKDPAFRAAMSNEERSLVPLHPAGDRIATAGQVAEDRKLPPLTLGWPCRTETADCQDP